MPPTAPHRRLPFRPDIEGLRGLAVLLVVAYHVGLPFLSGGFIGVDLFFVVSGYLITGLLVQEMADTGTIRATEFYARRMRRLLPAAVVVLTCTVVSAAVLLPPVSLLTVVDTARAAAAYLSNVYFSHAATVYFADSAATNPFLHTWSLAVEEQFYFVWPWLILLLVRFRSPRARWWGLIVVGLVSWVGATWYTIVRQPTAFYGMPWRAWEFAAGGLGTAVPWATASDRAQAWIARSGRTMLGWVGLLLVAYPAVHYTAATEFPGVSAVPPVLGAVCLLLVGAQQDRAGVGRLLTIRPLQTLGRLSYSWYLWHWPVLVLAAIVWPAAGLPIRAALAVLALGLAVVTFRLIEHPCRQWPALQRRPGRTIRLGLTVTALVIAATTGAHWWATRSALDPSQARYTAAHQDFPRLYADGCQLTAEAVPVASRCVYGDTVATTTLVLFGDSHMAQWFPAFDTLASLHHWRLRVMTKSACGVADVPVYSAALKRAYTECETWRRAVIDSMPSWQPTLVVLSASVGYVHPYANALADTTAWREGLTRTLRAIEAHGAPVVVLRDTPRPVDEIPSCLAAAAHRGEPAGGCDLRRTAAVNDAMGRMDAQAVAAVPDARYLDLTDALCGPVWCPAMLGGAIVYRDGDHMTATFARRLAPPLAAALRGAGFGTRLHLE